MNSRFYGKYRATVINIDPEQRGRIQVVVPAVSSIVPTSWTMPCVPIAGNQEAFVVPQVGAGVWVEFEGGDPNMPIWVGGCLDVADAPALAFAPAPEQDADVQTTDQDTARLSDAAPSFPTDGIVLRSPTGAMIVVNDSGIYLSNGQGASITMVGPIVTINSGALVVI